MLVQPAIPLPISKSSLVSSCFSLGAVITPLGGGPLGAGSSLCADFMIPRGGGPLGAGGSSLCAGKNAHRMGKKSL